MIGCKSSYVTRGVFILVVVDNYPSKHSKLIQRWYMLKQLHDVGQPDIHVDSMSLCQSWFIDKTQRWNSIGFRLILKTILFL